MAGLPRRRREDPALPEHRASSPRSSPPARRTTCPTTPAGARCCKADAGRAAAEQRRRTTTSTPSTSGPPASPTRSTSRRWPTSSTWSAKIADCCDDGALRRLVEGTPAYAELVDEDVSYQGKDGRKRWNELGDTIADSWERAIGRVDSWLSWQGDFSDSDFGDGDLLGPHRRRADQDRARRRHLPDRARLRARRRRGHLRARPRPRSSAATTPSPCSPKSPTWLATAARPGSPAGQAGVVVASWPTCEDDAFRRTGRAAYDLRKPSARGRRAGARAGRLLRPGRGHRRCSTARRSTRTTGASWSPRSPAASTPQD